MKKSILILFLLLGATSFAQEENLSFGERVAVYKAEAKKALRPFHYDNLKASYYLVNGSAQRKSVEVYLFGLSEYKFSFNAKGANSNVTVKFYDKPKNDRSRVLISEKKNVSGKEFSVMSSDLNTQYLAKEELAKPLKRVFVEYHIPADEAVTESSTGAMILVMGYQ